MYLVGVQLIQASNEKQREVWLIIHLHSGFHMDGLVSLVVSNEVQQKIAARHRLIQLCGW